MRGLQSNGFKTETAASEAVESMGCLGCLAQGAQVTVLVDRQPCQAQLMVVWWEKWSVAPDAKDRRSLACRQSE